MISLQKRKKIVLGVIVLVLAALVISVLLLQDLAPARKEKEPLLEHNLDEALQAIEVLEELGLE